MKQTTIAKKTGLSESFISRLLSEKNNSRPSFKSAKKLAIVTNTNPILWLEGDKKEIKQAIFTNSTI